MNIAQQNPPVTAVGLGVVVMNLAAAFTEMTGQQVAAIGGAVVIVAAFIAQRYTTPTGRA